MPTKTRTSGSASSSSSSSSNDTNMTDTDAGMSMGGLQVAIGGMNTDTFIIPGVPSVINEWQMLERQRAQRVAELKGIRNSMTAIRDEVARTLHKRPTKSVETPDGCKIRVKRKPTSGNLTRTHLVSAIGSFVLSNGFLKDQETARQFTVNCVKFVYATLPSSETDVVVFGRKSEKERPEDAPFRIVDLQQGVFA